MSSADDGYHSLRHDGGLPRHAPHGSRRAVSPPCPEGFANARSLARCQARPETYGWAVLAATIMISNSSRSRVLLPQLPAVPPQMLTTDIPARRKSRVSSVATKPRSRTAMPGSPSRGGHSADSTSVKGSKHPRHDRTPIVLDQKLTLLRNIAS